MKSLEELRKGWMEDKSEMDAVWKGNRSAMLL